MNTKQIGDIGLGKAISYFTSIGCTVSIPLTDSQDYDLIIDNGKLSRVQVKYTSYKPRKFYSVSFTIKGGNRSGIGKIKKIDISKVDSIFVYCENKSMFLIPSLLAENKYSATLNEKYKQYQIPHE